ncbi:MAG: oligosaccharide flippase family protein [Myxococcota bacterium]|nr:oligosaccharide flippase family protein [Myxococcota bacterium]
MNRPERPGNSREGVRRGLPYAALSGILQVVFALIGMLLLVRYLPPDDYGIWVLMVGIANPLILAVSLGHNQTILRFLRSLDGATERNAFLWSVWLRRCVAIVTILAIMWIFFPLWARPFGLSAHFEVFRALLPAYFAIGSSAYLEGALNTAYQQREIFWAFLASQLFFVVGILIGIRMELGLVSFAWIYCASSLIQSVIFFLACIHHYGRPKGWAAIRPIQETPERRHYRLTSWWDDLGTMLLSSPVNRLVLAVLGTTGEVAIYAVASNLVDRLLAWQPMQLFRPIATVSFFSRYEETGRIEDVNRMFRFVYAVNRSVTMLFVVLFIPFGERVLAWVFRPEYAQSYWPAALLLVGAVLFTAPTGVIAQTLKRPRVLLWSKVAVGVNLGLGIPLTLHYGASGMASAVVLSTLTKNLIIYVLLRLEFDLRFPWTTLLKYSAVTMLGILAALGFERWVPWLAASLLGAAVYVLSLRLFSVVDMEDRQLMITLAPRRARRLLKAILT